jgi:hypothetical protein
MLVFSWFSVDDFCRWITLSPKVTLGSRRGVKITCSILRKAEQQQQKEAIHISGQTGIVHVPDSMLESISENKKFTLHTRMTP